MNQHDQPRVPIIALVIALLIPLAFAGVVMVLLAQDGPHNVTVAGVPRHELTGLEVASAGEATVSAEAALTAAREWAEGARDGEIRQMALGRYSHEAVEYVRGRLVWVISFEPDPAAQVFISGPFGFDHSCDWAFHHDYILTIVDAETGEVLSSGGGAFFDPSLPPTFQSEYTNDRAYCERLQEEWRDAARSP